MTTVNEETARAQGYMEGRLVEQSKAMQEPKSDQQQMIDRIDRTNARIDRLNARIDRMMLAGLAAIGGALVATQLGLLGALIVFVIRMGSGS